MGRPLRIICTRFFPLGLLQTGNLVLANEAYRYCSVPFLQMMKETNMVLVYTASIGVHLEKFDSCRAALLLFILTSSMSFVIGDVTFSLRGFLLQGTAQTFDVTRIMLQSRLLQGSCKVDPLTVLLF